jgi:hypothetical protein
VSDYLVAVFVAPLLMWATSLGCGLAVERLVKIRLPNGLVLALGLCVSLVLVFPGYAAGAGYALAIVLLAVVTLAGFVFADGGVRARLNPGWPGIAGIATYVLYMLPVIAYGHWTWSGYDFVNDSAFQMLLAEHLKGFGTVLGDIPQSTGREFLKSYLNTGYPLGSQALLGTFSGLTGASVAVLYQGFISALAAIATITLATLTRRLLTPPRAAVVAFVALAANLTYQYALQGGIKEIALLTTVCAMVALAGEAVCLQQERVRPYVAALLVAVPAAAALAVYNAVALPYIGAVVASIVIAVALISGARQPRRWHVRPWGGALVAGVALTALLAIPSLVTFSTFFNAAQAGQGSSGAGATQFGQLLRPLPLSQVSGVWLAGEYRLPVTPEPAALLTLVGTVALLALLIPGVVWGLRRREGGPLLILGTMGLVLLIVFPRVSPYGQGKLLAIASPAVILVALTALLSARGRLAPLAVLATGALSLAVIASDLLAYGYDRVAPANRIQAIEQVGSKFRGEGPVLWNEFEEYAKVFAAAAHVYSPFEALTPEQVRLRNPTYFYGHAFDLDEELLSFVEAYPIIVTRRSPAGSRPPANYRLAYENRYYLGWRRDPRPRVLRHLPEQQLYSSSAQVSCPAVHSLVSRAPVRTQLVVAEAPRLQWFEPLYSADRPFGWGRVPGQAGAIVANTPGHSAGVLKAPSRGRYAVWVQGDFPRAIRVYVDGRLVGSVSGSNTPMQWLKAATVYLRAGPHRVTVTKEAGRRHFGPEEWGIGVVGAAALQSEEPERLHTLPLARWRELCGAHADWIELVRP